MKLLRRIFGTASDTHPEPVLAPPAPAGPFYAIGDIHGRADLLEALLHKIETEAVGHEASVRLVFVGDYVDRGDQSKAVLERLHQLCTEMPDQVICLLGNHEKMLLEFLDDPQARGQRWLRNGGLQTLASFGVGRISERATGAALDEARDRFRAAIGGPLVTWLRGLPRYWQSGNVAVVHAAADPALALDAQDANTLIWGHPAFLRDRRRDGLWVVHGHTIVPEPVAADGRIAVDTGAYATGRLTAAHISADGVRFLQT